MSGADPWSGPVRDRLLAASLLTGVSAERAIGALLTIADADPLAVTGEGTPRGWSKAISDPTLGDRLAAERARLRDAQGWFLTPVDDAWPGGTMPLGVLRGRGVLPARALSIVGARRADAYGREIAARIARVAVSAGYAVVSGGAFGIDVAAHRAALDAGGATVVVLGSGLSHPAPASHRALFAEACLRGAVVSPFPCHQTAGRWTFPRRNPWIAGLSDAVIVVQAGASSGALQTARAALEKGTPVWAVPGPMDAPLHVGCHALIAEGAKLLTAPDAWLADGARARPATGDAVEEPPQMVRMWRAATVEAQSLAALAEAAELDVSTAAEHATLLELQGWLRSAPGGRYVRSTPGG